MSIEKRIKALEEREQEKNSALPLIDYRWKGPELSELAFMFDGQIIDRLPGDSDEIYRDRALEICRLSHKGRTLPLLQSNEAYIGGAI